MSPMDLGWLFEETSQSRLPLKVPCGIGLELGEIYYQSNVGTILRDHLEQSAVGTMMHSVL